MQKIKAIKKFFEEGKYGRRVTMEEMKELTSEERTVLGGLCAEALGVELTTE